MFPAAALASQSRICRRKTLALKVRMLRVSLSVPRLCQPVPVRAAWVTFERQHLPSWQAEQLHAGTPERDTSEKGTTENTCFIRQHPVRKSESDH